MTAPSLSELLEAELRERLSRHPLVVWLDTHDVYSPFVDRLAQGSADKSFPAKVVAFRGSFLETLLELADSANHLDLEPLVVHVPGYNEKTIRLTPLLELYRAGRRFEKGWDTLVTEAAGGHVPVDDLKIFLKTSPGFLDAEQWLEARRAGQRGGLEGWLEEQSWQGLLSDFFEPTDKNGTRRRLVEAPNGLAVCRAYLHRKTGLDDDFLRFYLGDPPAEPEAELDALLDAFAAWLMSVEYVHDLRRAPRLQALRPLKDLPSPLVEVCQGLARDFRERHGDLYAARAGLVEQTLREEIHHVAPEDLGNVDTFQGEADRILGAAVEAVQSEDWERASAWAGGRPESSFWLRRDLGRRHAWALVRAAAELGSALADARAPLQGATTLADALAGYAGKPSAVDRAHRRFEQLRLARLTQQLPHFRAFQGIVDPMRRHYRRWADHLAETFADLCDRVGFLPGEEHRQRRIYERFVHARIEAGDRVVFFLIDAWRYEMAEALAESLGPEGMRPPEDLRLHRALAELPTLTAVGMNALAPVAHDGRATLKLDPKQRIRGFVTGELTVHDPKTRTRAMEHRSLGTGTAKVFDLRAVCDLNADSLGRACRDHRLIVVHSRDLDELGEADAGLATFASLQKQIRDAWQRFNAVGLDRFVMTSDHGFLLQDDTTLDPQPYGATQKVPSRRHVISPHGETPEGCARVRLSSLGYDGVDDRFLILRRDTKTFRCRGARNLFVHGGNSLQERAIPVLTGRFAEASRRRRRALERFEISQIVKPTLERGIYRWELLLRPKTEAQSVLAIARDPFLDVELRPVDSDSVELTVHDVQGGSRQQGRLRLPVDRRVTLHLDLRDEVDGRVQLEIFDPTGEDRLDVTRFPTFFQVAGRRAGPPSSELPEPPAGRVQTETKLPDWAEALDDAREARALVHLERHGTVTEQELVTLLGNARKARRFARRFDQILDRLPFAAEVQWVGGSKRYVKIH